MQLLEVFGITDVSGGTSGEGWSERGGHREGCFAREEHPIGAWEDELDVIRQGLVAESAKNRSPVWVPLDPLKPSFSYL